MLGTVLVYAGATALVFVGIIILSTVIGPKFRTPTKEKPFECGSISLDSIETIKVPLSFYDVALAFLVFDVEILFLFPLAWTWFEGNALGGVLFLLFLFILSLGLIFEIKQSRFFVY
ncbi:MAG: NADH-quinone oxidoreductase subunit A [Deltaproteobacteria bacterium]|nr:NADH-quinone oxidoreductase subunit A [Deltaproteobacteria bacterium]MCX7952086.1 NADH-quinone oxidoreductase subunit A [Deltaproteobacteria bacterium]